MKAVLVMASGREIELDESTTKYLNNLLDNEGCFKSNKPLIFNNNISGKTTDIIYPQHIERIHFIYE